MGVRGLTTYINNNQDNFLQTFLLHDSGLIIDGHSLCAQLYRLLNCFSAFGGDYDKFASYLKNFFKHLRKCNITPYVLFDGSYENRKVKTAYQRLRSKIYGASRLDAVTQSTIQIFPLLLREVFKDVLTEINIPFTICEFEADDEIAAMARHLDCPVLSYDSDFFIYNVMYIPFNTLDFKPKIVDINGNRTFALECKIYKVEHMIKNFGGLKEDMLPLLATLLGNDFVEKRVFSKFFSQFKLPKSKKKRNEQQRCIHALFKWLQNESLDTAISKILGRLKKKQKDKVLWIIKKSIDGYNSKHCRSLKYFNIPEDKTPETDWQIPDIDSCIEDRISDNDNDTPNDDNDNSSEIDNKSSDVEVDEEDDKLSENDECDEEVENEILGLPEWFAEGVRLKVIPQSYLNLYTHHLYYCSPQAEDYNDEDSFLCVLHILRYAFDILTDYTHKCCIYVSREKNSSYKRIQVDKEYETSRPYEICFHELSEDQLKLCFKHFLKQNMPLLDLTEVELLPSNFQLCLISILWWVAKCEVPVGHIHSLLITYVMLEAIDEKTGTSRGHRHFLDKYGKRIDELKKSPTVYNFDDQELFLNKNKLQYEDCLIAASVLLKHFELDDKVRKKPKSYDVKTMHSFAQYQCCLQQFNCLNLLCRNPFESTKYSKCFNGTFVYNIAVKLENQVDPITFFDQYLKGATTILLFYKSLSRILDRCMNQMGLTTTKWMGKKRRRRKNVQDDEINFIVKGFESEVFI